MYIRTLGNTVQLCRWQVDYTMANPDETTTSVTEYVPTEEEANELVLTNGGTKLALITSSDEWIDGIEVESYDEAVSIAQMGKTAYEKKLKQKESMKSENLLKENEYLKQQILDTQLALTELYESITVKTNDTMKRGAQ